MSILPFYFPSSSSSSRGPTLRRDSLVVSLHLAPSRSYWLIRISGILYAYAPFWFNCTVTAFIHQFSGLARAISLWCVCVSVHEDSNFWTKWLLAYWFTLTVSRSGSKVKVIGQSSRSSDRCWRLVSKLGHRACRRDANRVATGIWSVRERLWLLWPPCVADTDIIFLSCFFFFFSSPILSRRRLDVYHTSTHGVALVRI